MTISDQSAAKTQISTVSVIAVIIVIGVIWYASAQVLFLKDQVKADESQLKRYRMVLDIDPATPESVRQLTIPELQMKAASFVPQLNTLCAAGQKDLNEIQRLADVQMIDDNQKIERTSVARHTLSERFRSTVGTEIFVVDNEMRRRIDPQTLSGLQGVSRSVFAPDGTPLNPLSQLPPTEDFELSLSCEMVDSLDRLERAQPPQHQP